MHNAVYVHVDCYLLLHAGITRSRCICRQCVAYKQIVRVVFHVTGHSNEYVASGSSSTVSALQYENIAFIVAGLAAFFHHFLTSKVCLCANTYIACFH